MEDTSAPADLIKPRYCVRCGLIRTSEECPVPHEELDEVRSRIRSLAQQRDAINILLNDLHVKADELLNTGLQEV